MAYTKKRHQKEALKIYKSILIIFYALTIAVMCRYTIKHSDYDLDILLYTACALEDQFEDKNELHYAVYQLAKDELGSEKFQQYTDTTRIFRSNLYKNTNAFISMLPYYKVKSFYVFLLKGAHHFGLSTFKFSTLINLICYVIIAILLLLILTEYLNFYKGYTIAYFSLLMPTFTSTLKSNTPDLLTATLLLLAVYFLLIKQMKLRNLSLIFFAALIYSRNENIIFIMLFCTIGYLFFEKDFMKKYFLFLAGICLLTYFLNSNAMGESTWKELYKLTNLPPEDIHSPHGELSIKEYLLGFRRIPNNIFYCEVALILLFSILPLLSYKPSYKRNIFFLLLVSNLLFLVIRILLLPDISNRYFCGSYLISIICYFTLVYSEKIDEKMSHN